MFYRAQISKSLPRYRYGFVFGCNTFVTLVIETVLTVVVVDRVGFSVNVRTQVSFVFGCNTFMTLVIEVVLTVVVVDRAGLSVNVHKPVSFVFVCRLTHS